MIKYKNAGSFGTPGMTLQTTGDGMVLWSAKHPPTDFYACWKNIWDGELQTPVFSAGSLEEAIKLMKRGSLFLERDPWLTIYE